MTLSRDKGQSILLRLGRWKAYLPVSQKGVAHLQRLAALAPLSSCRLLEDAAHGLGVPLLPDRLISFLLQFQADGPQRVSLTVEFLDQRDGSLLCRILHEGLPIFCQPPAKGDLPRTLVLDYFEP